MDLYAYNVTNSDIVIQTITIDAQDSYQIPTNDLKEWCSDLTFRVSILCGLLEIGDNNNNYIPKDQVQDIMHAIMSDEVGTS
jgi:hypothetical protein